MNKALIAVVIVLLLGGGWYLLSNQSSRAPGDTTVPVASADDSESPGEAMVGEGEKVAIASFKFAPATLTVKKGTTVIWTNEDSVAHTVTSDTGSELGSELLGKGASYAYTFDTVGSFPYHCAPHPNMKATVTVIE